MTFLRSATILPDEEYMWQRRTPAFLVEDHPHDVLLFQHAWQKLKVKQPLVVFSTGEQALEALRETGNPKRTFFSLVFLDLKLPGKSGFEVLTWIRQDAKLCRLPVVVLTGSSQTIDIYRAYELGANSYLVKPVSPSVLSEILQKLKNQKTGCHCRRCPPALSHSSVCG